MESQQLAQRMLQEHYHLYTNRGHLVWGGDSGEMFYDYYHEAIESVGCIDAPDRRWVGKNPADYILLNYTTGQQYNFAIWHATITELKQFETVESIPF